MAKSGKHLSSFFVIFSISFHLVSAELSPDFYCDVCPEATATIRLLVYDAIVKDPRMGASFLRLHFHDCFVNGCDASVLLDDTPTFVGEKSAGPNKNSLRGFEVIDEIKAAVNLVCLGNVVSCSDILAVAARDSVVALGGKSYTVLLGRRDATSANFYAVNKNLPSPSFDLPTLLSNFHSQNLSLRDLVLLSGAHTLGFARCTTFRSRIYDERSTMDPIFQRELQAQCPPGSGGGDMVASFDDSPTRFDTDYFSGLKQRRGLLHSDQQLFKGDGGDADALVSFYSENKEAFWEGFGEAMVKMGSLKPLDGSGGEIREHCRYVNADR